MSGIRVIRGTASLPPDFEEQFFAARGREMTLEERNFFGLTPRTENPPPAECERFLKAD